MNEGSKRWQNESKRLTKERCHKLLKALNEEHLDPILRKLSGKDGALVSFAQIIGGYSTIEQGFKRDSQGAKDTFAQFFYGFHPVEVMQAEMEEHIANLQQLKDFDESFAFERQEKACHEQESQQIEESNDQFEEQRRAKEKEIEILRVKQEQDRKRLEEQSGADMKAQREQMDNMMTANMGELIKGREKTVPQNQILKEETEQMQQSLNKKN